MTGFVAALTNYGGGDLNNLALSKSTTRRFRVAARKTVATNILRNFICDVGQINFDGKLLPDLYGFGKVNRLAVVLVQEDHNQLLCIAKTSDATGRTEAVAVKAALDKWDISTKVIAIGFDTTSSNTGVHRGACTILQQLLERQLLWLACRHHVPELVVGASFTCLFGDTSSPEVTLFKVLKNRWDELDLGDLQLPTIPAVYKDAVQVGLDY